MNRFKGSRRERTICLHALALLSIVTFGCGEPNNMGTTQATMAGSSFGWARSLSRGSTLYARR